MQDPIASNWDKFIVDHAIFVHNFAGAAVSSFRVFTFYLFFRSVRVLLCVVMLIIWWMHLNSILIERKNCVNGKQSAAKFEYFIGATKNQKKNAVEKKIWKKPQPHPPIKINSRMHLLSGRRWFCIQYPAVHLCVVLWPLCPLACASLRSVQSALLSHPFFHVIGVPHICASDKRALPRSAEHIHLSILSIFVLCECACEIVHSIVSTLNV